MVDTFLQLEFVAQGCPALRCVGDLNTRHFVQYSDELAFEYQHYGPILGWLLKIRTKIAQLSHKPDHSVGYWNGSIIWISYKCLFYVQMAFASHCTWIAINLWTVFGSSLIAVVVVAVDANFVSGGANDGARTGTSAQQERIQRSYCHWNKDNRFGFSKGIWKPN